jgi:hypothetical protein
MDARPIPDFIIIGRMKCGTTTIASWLADQPEIRFSKEKEPQFFTIDRYWKRGTEWYASLYEGARADQLRGEATTNCTNPDMKDVAAPRLASHAPDARLIYVIRHPAARIASHYRRMRILGQESASLVDALRKPGSPPLRHSMYYTLLEPYIERFSREQILVVRMEDVVSPEGPGWRAILSHLGLAYRIPPTDVFNASEDQALFSSPVRWIRRFGLQRSLSWVPKPLTQGVKAVLGRRGDAFNEMLEESKRPIPADVMRPVWEDIEKLEHWMGAERPLWQPEPDAARRD